jgi:NAD(P)-dependent dehydrogenase (short-subunit alcohol dehydrogenase family)
MADHSITGKKVLIAGGGKNLGGLLATDLAGHGAKAVAIHYNSASSAAEAQATLAAIKAAGAQGFAFQADLPARVRWKNCSAMPTAMGSIDIAVNTVGKVLKKPMVEISEGIRPDERGQLQDRLLLPEGSGQARQRRRQGLHAGNLAAGCFHALYATRATAPVEHYTLAQLPKSLANAAFR